MPAQLHPHLIRGHIYGPKGLVSNATVTLTLNSNSTSVTSNEKGEYILSMGATDFPDGWGSGDTVSIKASKPSVGTKTVSLVLTDAPQEQNITLAQTSSLSFYQDTDSQNRYPLKFSLLVDFDGNKFSADNPLYVYMDDRPLTRLVSQTAYPKYIGEAAPGSLTGEAAWRIKYVQSSGKVTWADGSGEFNKKWDNRTGYSYS